MPVTNHPVVGTVTWEPVKPVQPGGPVRFLDNFEAQNIVTVTVPQLVGTPTFGGAFNGQVRFYRKAAAQLLAAWAEVAERGLMDRVLFWAGSYVPRMIRGSTTKPSNHTFGTAFDINHQWNGLGVIPPPAGKKGSVRELVPIFEKHGFLWGGNFKNRPDGMHFEIARLGKPQSGQATPSVEVFINGAHQVVPALLIQGRTWVGVRALVKLLGGSIVSVTADPFAVTVRSPQGNEATIPGRNVDGIGYVAFADLIPLYGFPFQFNSAAKRLSITKP